MSTVAPGHSFMFMEPGCCLSRYRCGALDYESQLISIRDLLNRNKKVDVATTRRIERVYSLAIKARGTSHEQATDEWIELLHGSTYQRAAHSMAALGMLVPLYESMFYQAFQSVRKRMFGETQAACGLPSFIATGDLDRDGNPDFVLGCETGVGVYFNNGHGRVGDYLLLKQPNQQFGGQVLIADLNGDGIPDIAAEQAADAGVYEVNGPIAESQLRVLRSEFDNIDLEPGSLEESTQGARHGGAGWKPGHAIVSRYYTSQASCQRIFSHYDEEFKTRGWRFLREYFSGFGTQREYNKGSFMATVVCGGQVAYEIDLSWSNRAGWRQQGAIFALFPLLTWVLWELLLLARKHTMNPSGVSRKP